jgi:predicted GNAT superfamily acetyltransferase
VADETRPAAGLDVAELHENGELRALVELLDAVWGRAGGPPLINLETLRALAHAGAYIAGARADGRLVGGLVGFFGRDADGTLTLHSHILGVRESARGEGVGHALKLHQGRWALARGIREVRWTFDPLVRRNAHFNLVGLGAEPIAYHEDFYGRMDDAINAADPTDRLVVRWRVADPRPAIPDDAEALRARGAEIVLREGPRGEPVPEPPGPARVRLCQVPEDIVALRRTRPEAALAWRLALREALGGGIRAGARVVGMVPGGWYVLERGAD